MLDMTKGYKITWKLVELASKNEVLKSEAQQSEIFTIDANVLKPKHDYSISAELNENGNILQIEPFTFSTPI